MKKIVVLLVIIFLIIFVVRRHDDELQMTVNVQAAASMQNALSEIEDNFENSGFDIEINYGGSGMLVTQIQEGAPADIFISASIDNFEALKKTNSLVEETILVDNQLVLITAKNSSISTLAEANTIAIGTPQSVPAGAYALEVIDYLGVEAATKDKLVQAKDVTEVLTYVETGNADVGFVYNTDMIASSEVKVIDEYDNTMHSPISYPLGLLTDDPAARAFYEYLQSNEAISIFEKYGFTNHE
ncbi:molybdate ABC transporter substrate-binding protein [Mollicutes bacterium LVI A0039]|nr:molybdate ABC transporter substrate-binding protein [Mollicutes bacterium LVI A0039]